jgi:hypothetical protein
VFVKIIAFYPDFGTNSVFDIKQLGDEIWQHAKFLVAVFICTPHILTLTPDIYKLAV